MNLMLEKKTNLTFRTRQRWVTSLRSHREYKFEPAIVGQESQRYLLAAASCDLEDRTSEPSLLFMMLKLNEKAMRTNLTFLASNLIDRYWAWTLRKVHIYYLIAAV
jgi:hypothetical protein